MTSPSFNLGERYELGGHSYSWRLKDGEIRFRGTGRYAGLVTQRIPASDAQILIARLAFDLLDVWAWRNDYHPNDAEMQVCDGSTWSFDVTFGEKTNQSAGENAYPSFSDTAITSLTRDRFDLLVAAIHSCFCIDHYTDQAQQFANTAVHRNG